LTGFVPENQVRTGLSAGASAIRTAGPTLVLMGGSGQPTGLPGRLLQAPGKRSGGATRIVCHSDALCSFLRAQSFEDDVVLDGQLEGFGSSVLVRQRAMSHKRDSAKSLVR